MKFVISFWNLNVNNSFLNLVKLKIFKNKSKALIMLFLAVFIQAMLMKRIPKHQLTQIFPQQSRLHPAF